MKRIMFVDDDGSASRLTVSLREEGFEVVSSGDKFEAFSTIVYGLERGRAFDLLVLPVELPSADGLELSYRLRAAGIEVACLALISFLDETLLVELLQRKCMDYLERPVSPEELTERVRHMLEEEREEKSAH
jgi:two-component system alkaline phosphatase synthesis response regulator PhoP